MFRFLIIEDIKSTAEQLKALLAESFPDSRDDIEVATTVREAQELTDRARDDFYDAVILDLKLPSEPGHYPEVDESLCLRIKDKPTMVAHITAFLDDPRVQDHIRRVHTQELTPLSFVLSKREVQWASILVEKLKTYLFSSYIDQQMAEIFGGGTTVVAASSAVRNHYRSRGHGCTTHRLASLCRDIEAQWNVLDSGLKTRIRQKFNVETGAAGTQVSLL